MEERRVFVDWVKCPIEFGKTFEYVKFDTDYRLYKYDGFHRIYRERDHTQDAIVLNFRQVFLNENNELKFGYIKQFHPGWYNNATYFTEAEVMQYLKKQNEKLQEKEREGWFKKWLKSLL